MEVKNTKLAALTNRLHNVCITNVLNTTTEVLDLGPEPH